MSSRPFRTTGVHLPSDLWELLNTVAFERARTKGGRASVSALTGIRKDGALGHDIQRDWTGDAASVFDSILVQNH